MVSVIIPTYNRYELLKEAIESVCLQECPDLEIIVADDGSDDGTGEIPRLYPGLHYHRYEHTGFPGLMRNRGAAHARGDLLAFLDSDDLWLPDKIASQLQLFASAADTSCVHTKELWLRNGRTVSQRRRRHRREGDVFSDALHKCMIGPSTVLMRTEVFHTLGGFREDLEVAEDYEFWLRYSACHQLSYIDEPLIIKRAGHDQQLSEKYGQIEIFHIRGLRDLVDRHWFLTHATEAHDTLAREVLAEKCVIYGGGALKRGRDEEARYYSELAARYRAPAAPIRN